MTTEAKVAAVDAYLAALNAGDLEAVMNLYAEDATLEDPVGSDIKVGKAAIREFYTGATSMKLQAERLGDARCAGSEVAFPFAVTTTMDGTTSTIQVIDVFKFNDEDKIISMRAFWGPENVMV
ncbi:SnoaL-like domain-containing protein [Pseudomaricurvus alkylphenolicus]|uniref:nuclear transport factor 2 family protein n=1 Tax=Pseudomaricurvus alkylphenolicus TaxID=1306991 RepID=UPI0014226D15|nr:nuclear transport factor 2 family protein [Pseudomaricurvus alkylphenolicus]NIB43539.1 SnoaL-like domain-containing protein [Pseudomaricurvus alkylphenolicus]